MSEVIKLLKDLRDLFRDLNGQVVMFESNLKRIKEIVEDEKID